LELEPTLLFRLIVGIEPDRSILVSQAPNPGDTISAHARVAGSGKIRFDCQPPQRSRKPVFAAEGYGITDLHGMSLFGQQARMRVPFKALLNVKDCPDFQFTPALIPLRWSWSYYMASGNLTSSNTRLAGRVGDTNTNNRSQLLELAFLGAILP
jgi:hypothetical protein